MAGVLRAIPDGFREFFLLERAQRDASARSADQETKIRDFMKAAASRLAAAESLTGGDQVPAALILYREGVIFTIRAIVESRGRDSSAATAADAFRSLASLAEAGEVPAPPDGFDAVRDLLTETRPMAFDELPTSDALRKRAQVESTAHWLHGLVEARTVREIKWSRYLRLGAGALAIVALFGYATYKGVSPRNVALGKPAQISSRRPQCPPGSGEAGVPASGIVDGSTSNAYDICTNYEVRPWVMVDLQDNRRISKVVAYYRSDCCWGSYDLPAVLELSEDGTNFREVARRTTAYSTADPWVIKLDRQSARYVRIRVDANEPRELVMTEIEVYAPRF